MLKSGLDVAHVLGKRRHPTRCATDTPTLIVVSWTVQAMNSQEGVEQFEPQLAPHLPRHARLNVSRVRAGRSLDEGDPESQ